MSFFPIGGLLVGVSQATVFLSPDIHVLMGLWIFGRRYVVEAVLLRVLRALLLLEPLQIFPRYARSYSASSHALAWEFGAGSSAPVSRS